MKYLTQKMAMIEVTVETMQEKVRVGERSSHESRRRIDSLTNENAKLLREVTQAETQLAESQKQLEYYFSVSFTTFLLY